MYVTLLFVNTRLCSLSQLDRGLLCIDERLESAKIYAIFITMLINIYCIVNSQLLKIFITISMYFHYLCRSPSLSLIIKSLIDKSRKSK